jgi:hypothetical protein
VNIVVRQTARCIGLGVAGMALAGTAMAQAQDTTNVTSISSKMRLGGEFRSELKYDDHGVSKTDGYTPKKSTDFELQVVNLKLMGNINEQTEFAARIKLVRPSLEGPVDYAYGTYWATKDLGLSIGRMKLIQGGWDNWDGDYRQHAIGFYRDNLPFSTYQDMFQIGYKVAGIVRLQVFNDKTTATGGQWNQDAHPTWDIGYQGEFGSVPVHPVVDYGSYDNNKSSWIDAGVKAQMSDMRVALDYYRNSQSDKVLKSGSTDKYESKENVATAYTLAAAYEVKNVATPWLYFSAYDNKQHDTDLKTNVSKSCAAGEANPLDATDLCNAAQANGVAYAYNDNGTVWGLGADMNFTGKNWHPYIAFVERSGKFDKNNGTGTVKEDTRNNLWIRVGAHAEL